MSFRACTETIERSLRGRGGCDGLLIALVAFAAIDYITGLMCAISEKRLNSKIGFKGICRKVLIFTLVGVANIIDVQVIGTGSVLMTAVIFFYLSPKKLKDILEQLHDRIDEEDDKND